MSVAEASLFNFSKSFSLSKSEGVRNCKINNKRYLGNKYKILGFIKEVVRKECADVRVVADIFAGTGAVASAFPDKEVIVNDILYSNYLSYIAWFGNQDFSNEKLKNLIFIYNNAIISEDNYMSINFSDTFFSAAVCRKIGFIREDIEYKFKRHALNERERAILITSLLYAIDKIANTCGHYDAYRRNGIFNEYFEMLLPTPAGIRNNNKIYNMDANLLVKRIKADFVYIDPPYNSRQYCDAYHLPENIAKWEKPPVSGVARKMDRAALKSAYCTSAAVKAFEALVSDIDAKYILLSYNNMGAKGTERSNARILDADIFRILRAKGELKVFSQGHKPFNAGKRLIENNEERLFLCICK